MSRRSSRYGNVGGAGWLGKAALALIACGVLVAGILYGAIRNYLHSEGFRRFLSDKASHAAQVSGDFTPFRWDGLAADTAAFEATGEGVVRELRVEGLHTEIGVGGLSRGVWEIAGSRAQRLEISLDARNKGGTSVPKIGKKNSPKRARKKGWLPREVEIQGLSVGEIVVKALLKQGPASVTGMRLCVEQAANKNSYMVELADGAIVLPFGHVPEIRLERARLRYQDGRVFLNSATASAWRNGRLEASGEWDAARRAYATEGNVSGVGCDEFFNETWAKRFTGEASSDFTLVRQGGPPVASGRMTIRNGTLTALPVLNALAAYADTRRFRMLALSEAHTDWHWQDGETLLSGLVLASEGLVRLEGGLSIRAGKLDGSFRLGLAPGTLASIPGAENDVFSPGERGLMWTPLRITGTLDDLKEDLTVRLVEAAGLRMLDVDAESGGKLIKYSRSLLGESPAKAIGQGLKIIKDNPEIIDQAGGLLDGILGGGRRKKKEAQ